ncbi:VWA domain-containing protein [Virgisporangium ochraceum]|uniref:Membrane protein n=1 Tax=Virgisporangium ochraceum TaxID=65505 RepID=A0A8J4EF87_9ACTN|nr:VWA domain-containing protein [Virgisporangium ochraceum]GIJ69807.1 membrane protein [Virgisporangium ochraceum]
MTFESPARLWLLIGVAALAIAYVFVQRRRSRYTVRFTNLALLDKVAPKRPGWRRHLPAGLFLAMLVPLVAGFARPADDVEVPRERATVIVAVDASTSMRATDVDPSRLQAAEDAAREFVRGLPEEFNVGLVTFAGGASLQVAPTTDRAALEAGIERISDGYAGAQGTAIGGAIDAALQAIRGFDAEAGEEPPPARVVVLSDGANTSGRNPAEVSAEAAAAEVPVDTIAFGTADGTISQGGRTTRVPVDGGTLEQVATATGGGYHEAGSSDELRAVYEDIGSDVGYVTRKQDVSARFIGVGLIFAMAAAATSMLWFARLP